LKKNGNITPDQLKFAKQIVEWMEKDGRGLLFGSGQNRSVAPDLRQQGIDFKPIYLGTDGRLYLQFGAWEGRPVFGSSERRSDLVRRFAAVNNADLDESSVKRFPNLTLQRILQDPDGRSKILAALN
jgi:hypothetical protein